MMYLISTRPAVEVIFSLGFKGVSAVRGNFICSVNSLSPLSFGGIAFGGGFHFSHAYRSSRFWKTMIPWLSVIYLNTSLGFYPTTLVCFCYCNEDPMAALLYQEWVTQTTVTEAIEHGSGTKRALMRTPWLLKSVAEPLWGKLLSFLDRKLESMGIKQFLPKTHPQWPQDCLLGFTPKIHFIYLKSMFNPVMVFFREKAFLNSEFKPFTLCL